MDALSIDDFERLVVVGRRDTGALRARAADARSRLGRDPRGEGRPGDLVRPAASAVVAEPGGGADVDPRPGLTGRPDRQGEDDPRPASDMGFGPDRAAVRLDEAAGDREAEAGTRAVRSLRASSAFQNRSKMCVLAPREQADSAVLDGDVDAVVARPRRSTATAPSRRVCVGAHSSAGSAARVRPCRVRPRSSGVASSTLAFEADVAGAGLCVDGAQAGLDDLPRLRLLQLERQCAGVDAGELEEVVDQEREAANLFAGRGEVLLGVAPGRPRPPRASPGSPRRACASRGLPRRRVAGGRRRSARRSPPSR